MNKSEEVTRSRLQREINYLEWLETAQDELEHDKTLALAHLRHICITGEVESTKQIELCQEEISFTISVQVLLERISPLVIRAYNYKAFYSLATQYLTPDEVILFNTAVDILDLRINVWGLSEDELYKLSDRINEKLGEFGSKGAYTTLKGIANTLGIFNI